MGQFDEFIPKVGLTNKGNRAVGESVVVKKDRAKPKVAFAAGNPPNPPKPPKEGNDKKEPAPYNKKKPPEGGLGDLVRK